MLAADLEGHSLDTQAGKKEPWTKEQEQEQEQEQRKANKISSEDAGGYIYTPTAHASRRERDADRKLKRFATTMIAAHLSHSGLTSPPAHDAMRRTQRYRMLH